MDVFRRTLSFPMYAAAAWLLWVVAQQTDAGGLARVLAAALVLAIVAWLFGLSQRRQAVDRGSGALTLSVAAALGLAGALWLAAGGTYASSSAAHQQAAASGETPSEPWSPERVAALRAAHRPVLVNFTAAWCVTCQVNERVVFSSREVADAFRRSGAVYLVGDWTNHNGAIAEALDRQGRIGVPLYLVYGTGGGEPAVLPQLLSPSLVAEALDRAARPGA